MIISRETQLVVTLKSLKPEKAAQWTAESDMMVNSTPFVVPLPFGEVAFPIGTLRRVQIDFKRADFDKIDGIPKRYMVKEESYDVLVYFNVQQPTREPGWDFTAMIGTEFDADLSLFTKIATGLE